MCGRALGRSCQNRSLWLGWWGIIAIFRNLAVVWGNSRSLQRLSGLPVRGRDPLVVTPLSTPMAPGRAVFARSGFWFLVAIASVIGSAARAGSFDKQEPATFAVGECVSGVTTVTPVHCSESHSGRIVLKVFDKSSCPSYAESYVTFGAMYLCVDDDG